jgi:hypothetical protein
MDSVCCVLRSPCVSHSRRRDHTSTVRKGQQPQHVCSVWQATNAAASSCCLTRDSRGLLCHFLPTPCSAQACRSQFAPATVSRPPPPHPPLYITQVHSPPLHGGCGAHGQGPGSSPAGCHTTEGLGDVTTAAAAAAAVAVHSSRRQQQHQGQTSPTEKNLCVAQNSKPGLSAHTHCQHPADTTVLNPALLSDTPRPAVRRVTSSPA